tara:strand:+ start:1072 stop:1605 length:534 start_codon:yes stop_codon:yes gene_type:complete
MPMTKEEKKAYDKKYYIENKEKRKKQNKEYSEANKEILKQNQKKYHIENKDKLKQNQKQYYIDNKEKIIERTNKYNEANKEKIKEKRKEYIKTEICKKNNTISSWIYTHKIKFVDRNEAEFYYNSYINTHRCTWCDKMFKDSKERNLDHCHICSLPRAIICRSCNKQDLVPCVNCLL